MTDTGPAFLLQALDVVAVVRGDQGDVRVLDGVTLHVAPGEIVDIVGESGVGKTTLLRVLARLLPGASARLLLAGEPAADIPGEVWRARVALLPQKPAFVQRDVRTNLLLPWSLRVHRNESAPTEATLRSRLNALGLSDVALDRDVARLSVGQLARVAFVRTVLTGPRVLLLDEADAALDETSSQYVTDATRVFSAGGGSVVRVRHRASDGLAARRLRLSGGRLEEAAS